MKFALSLHRHLAWFNLPAALLVALLQRTPVVRVATAAGEFLTASPAGAVLKATVAALGSLGAVHSLAGATQLTATVRSPLSATAGVAISPVAFAITGAPLPAASWRITGSIPPGLTLSGVSATPTTINGSSLTLSGTPTTAGSYSIGLVAYEGLNLTKSSASYTYVVTVAAAAAVAPVITLQPQSQTVAVGASVTFNSAASGTPSPTYQWRKDGLPISGATSVSYTISSAQLTDAGVYTVVATNATNSATSGSATLTVNAPATTKPVFVTQPASLTVALGSTAVLNSTATGATTYRWQRNGLDLPGETSPNLVLKSLTALAAGTYTVVATNSAGPTTSSPATLAVTSVAAVDATRLVNLSILTTAGPGAKVLTVGAVVGPLNFSGTLPLVIRAVGPTLGTFGLTGVLADPTLTLNASGVTAPLATNDNWGGGAPMIAAFSSVGAFALSSPLDSAALSSATPGGYTVQVTGKDSSTGLVIAEIYDASTTRTAASPRLINLSTLTEIDSGSTLAVGFVLRGATARTVLVRGIGPTLGTLFGLGGVMTDPKLELFNNDTGAKVTENDNWGGDAQLMDAAASVGAFALADTATKDAVLLVTLPPGAYSARVSGIGTSAGTAIIEVYELP